MMFLEKSQKESHCLFAELETVFDRKQREDLCGLDERTLELFRTCIGDGKTVVKCSVGEAKARWTWD